MAETKKGEVNKVDSDENYRNENDVQGNGKLVDTDGSDLEVAGENGKYEEAEEEEERNGTPKLSKNAQKKLAKQKINAERKAARKIAEKTRKKEEADRKRKEREDLAEGGSETKREGKDRGRSEGIEGPNEEEKRSGGASIRQRDERKLKVEEALKNGQNIVIDLDFLDLMAPKELASLQQQVLFSYGLNCKAEFPCRLSLTSCSGTIRERLERISGFDKWKLLVESLPYIEAFADRKDDLVYLTADSPNEIEVLDPKKIYIIGGIVDRNRHKNVTMEKARNQGIATAKLPISKHVKLTTSQVLTVNQVMDIILKFQETKDWSKAFLLAVPQRKKKEESAMAEEKTQNNPSGDKSDKEDPPHKRART